MKLLEASSVFNNEKVAVSGSALILFEFRFRTSNFDRQFIVSGSFSRELRARSRLYSTIKKVRAHFIIVSIKQAKKINLL